MRSFHTPIYFDVQDIKPTGYFWKKMKNKQSDWQSELSRLVFSTDGAILPDEEQIEEEALSASDQLLRIWLEKKGRGGKQATLIKGYIGDEENLRDLSTLLKKHCGTGGSVKDNEIIIQGDQRKKVLDFLISKGYTRTKLAGG